MEPLSFMPNSRRNFCKNASLISIGLGFLPFLTSAKANQTKVVSLKKNAKKVVNVYGKICYNDLSPAQNTTIEVWHNNSEHNPSKFEYEGKVTTDSAGNYTFETDFPEKHFEDRDYMMRRIFFKIKDRNGEEVLTKLYFGESGKAFIDGFHVANTHPKFRSELPKTKSKNENLLLIQFNIYINH